LDQAYKHGVLVATKEDFPRLIDQTMLFPNSDILYKEAEETLRCLQNPSPFSGTAT
jgi:hypothetical protein